MRHEDHLDEQDDLGVGLARGQETLGAGPQPRSAPPRRERHWPSRTYVGVPVPTGVCDWCIWLSGNQVEEENAPRGRRTLTQRER